MNYIGLFLFFSFATIFLMKLVAYLCAKAENVNIDEKFFYTSPILCPKTYQKDAKKLIRSEITFELLFSTFALIIIHNYYQILINQFEFVWSFKEFFLIFYVYIFTMFMSNTFRTISLAFNTNPTAMHKKPYLSKHLNEFWTRRWNVWVRNWLHYLGKKLFPKNVTMRQFSIFFISGLFHESMFNVPYYVHTGELIFGTMMGYFMIQFIAMKIDFLVLKKYAPQMRYPFMWIAIILPAPLFINKAFLLFFGFDS